MSAAAPVLVVGASGGTGRALVLRALARGLRVRAWSQHRGELPLSHPDLEHVEGDVRDARVASRAVAGTRAVLSALGSRAGLSPTTLCDTGTEVLLGAMRGAGVRRLVAITSLGTTGKMGPVHERLLDPLIFRRIYDDKRAQEERIRKSGLDWVLVRPGRLTDAPDRRRTHAVLEGPLPGVHVSRSALARFLLDQLESDRFVGRAPYLVEPSVLGWHKLLTLGFDARPV